MVDDRIVRWYRFAAIEITGTEGCAMTSLGGESTTICGDLETVRRKKLTCGSRLVGLALAIPLAGCSASAPAADLKEGEEQPLVIPPVSAPCDIGVSYATNATPSDGGNWDETPLADDVGLHDGPVLTGGCMPRTPFWFGATTDIPLLFGTNIATYGTTVSDDRLGRFFIDRNNSNSWDAGDTFTRFMPDPQPGDQPFTMQVLSQKLSGGSCVADAGLIILPVVIGIRRGSVWYIDANRNGTWDGTSQCDIMGNFGAPSDIMVPVPGQIAVARENGPSLQWFFDTDGSFFWNGSPPDTALTAFGSSEMYPISDAASGRIGAAFRESIFLDKNDNHMWDGTPTDIAVTNFVPRNEDNGMLPPTGWRFVGWFTAQPGPPNPPK